VAELRFRVGAIFPADNPTARYVMALSIALEDLRTASDQLAREGLPAHERLYFTRLLELHVREGLCLAVMDYRDREDVQRFVAILPEEARDARAALDRLVTEDPRPQMRAFAELGRIGDDTFHHARERRGRERLTVAMESVGATESGYRLEGERKRADFADLVVAGALAPGASGGTPELTGSVLAVLEELLPPLVTYLEHAEAAWLRPWLG